MGFTAPRGGQQLVCDYTSAVTRFDPHGQGLSVAFAQFRGQDYVQGILDTSCSFDTVGELALKEIQKHVRGSLRKGETPPLQLSRLVDPIA